MLKDLLTFLIMPFSFTLIMVFIGLIQIHRKKYLSGKIFLWSGLLLLYLFGNSFIAGSLLKPLELQHPPLLDPAEHPLIAESEQAPVIVVLASGHYTTGNFPVTSQMGQSSWYRMAEGLRVHHALPGSRLIFMGGNKHEEKSTGEIKLRLLQEIGMSTEQILLLPDATNTEEEAVLVARLLFGEGDTPLILVTSARHMTRSMLLFQKTGLDPIPAPTRHSQVVMGPPKKFHTYFIWSPGALLDSHRAVNEYAGMVWSRVRGRG
ncbi:MAG: hypothetical protein EA360_11140 [Balneolaceae bacterium]|nr:MAG: hypothetical protein EA360_11140 [Balneolaceae bacterium]